ncbi:MAG: pyridoxal phosphate-dependent aminotransferase [Rhizomicrobium sp.]
MHYKRMPIEVESPEEYGYALIRNNLSESSVTDRTLSGLGFAIPDLALLYAEHRGNAELRAAIVADEPSLAADDVLLTMGAAGALFIVSTSLLGPGDNLVVIRPNYATNLETPRAIGCSIAFVDLKFENGFRIDFDELAAAITPRTKLISVTCPHNPTGTMFSLADLDRLVALARAQGCYLLVDETYRDLTFGEKLPLAATRDPCAISVSSLSKAYGVPGIRVGWLIARDPRLKEIFLAAKEQISICGSVIDEWIALQILHRRRAMLAQTMTEMTGRRDLVVQWLAGEELLEYVPPAGGVVCFPRMRAEPKGGTDAFYKRLLAEHGTYVGPGHWFERPDTYFRLGFGWPSFAQLEAGLVGISRALRG